MHETKNKQPQMFLYSSPVFLQKIKSQKALRLFVKTKAFFSPTLTFPLFSSEFGGVAGVKSALLDLTVKLFCESIHRRSDSVRVGLSVHAAAQQMQTLSGLHGELVCRISSVYHCRDAALIAVEWSCEYLWFARYGEEKLSQAQQLTSFTTCEQRAR